MRLSCAPVMGFRGATGSRPPGRGGRQPGGILHDNDNIRAISAFQEDYLGTPRRASPQPVVENQTGCFYLYVFRCCTKLRIQQIKKFESYRISLSLFLT